ncbi:MAG TPA: ABC transporter substrate-binding protein [Solirubrobacteraceae bacterium]|nr:ABC transporter substrate-binding protein [Solirubrobacteraceae bacterium]
MFRARLAGVLLVAALTLSACGAGGSTTASSQATSTSGDAATGVAKMLIRSWPALDPATDSATGASVREEDVDWFVYTGLTTYSRTGGRTKLIPGLAQSMPMVLGDENTYVATLRKGLVFSNGQPVTAEDFLYTVERDLRIHQSAAVAEFAGLVVGARKYEDGASKTLSGISVDDTTGTIVIRLTVPDTGFDRLLALPALGLVPASTPDRPSTVIPPSGAGPYELTNIVPKRSFSVVQNPEWASLAIPGLPSGQVNINVEIDPRLRGGALAVFHGGSVRAPAFRPHYGFDLTSLALG